MCSLSGDSMHTTESLGVKSVSKAKRGVPSFGHTKQLRVFVDPD